MYTVMMDDKVLLVGGSQDIPIIDGEIKYKLNSAAEWELTLLPSNPRYDEPVLRKSIVEVYWDSMLVWRGCVSGMERDFLNRKKLILANELSFFRDTMHGPFTFSNSPENFLSGVIRVHNEMCGVNTKQLTLGNVTVSAEVYNCEYTTYETHFDLLRDAIKAVGGYLRTRRVGGITYVDWGESFGSYGGDHAVVFGRNLLNLDELVDTSDMITCLYPVGKDDITIASVNGGLKYIVNETAAAKYGNIFGTKRFSDVETAADLMEAGESYLASAAVVGKTLELTALDLPRIGENVGAYEYGYTVPVISAPHGLDTQMLITEQIRPLVKPSGSKIVLGKELPRLTKIRSGWDARAVQVEAAMSAASRAEGAANSAASAAGTAQATANTAASTASKAQSTANSAKNVTDGIETGVWNASINHGTIASQHCTYMKVGNMCTISFMIEGTGVNATVSSTYYLEITGVPYAPSDNARWYGGGGHVQGLSLNSGYHFTGFILQASNNTIFARTYDGNSGLYCYIANGDADFYLSGTITYPIAQ